MRVRQLARLMERYGPDDIEVVVRPVACRYAPLRALSIMSLPRDAVFIIPKRVLMTWPQSAILALRQRARAIFADYVDGNLDIVPREGVDVHLSTSFIGESGLRTWMDKIGASGETRVLLHNVDERLERRAPKQSPDALDLLFVGSPQTTVVPETVAPHIRCLPGTTPDEFEKARSALQSSNAHYCIRADHGTRADRKFKPFTKGFTAAWCGANILVNRQADDAVHFLGEDYPFMAQSQSPEDILATINRMRDGLGGPDWKDALARGQDVAERIRPERLAKDLKRFAFYVSRMGFTGKDLSDSLQLGGGSWASLTLWIFESGFAHMLRGAIQRVLRGGCLV